MEINKSNIQEIVNKCGLAPDKDYGQNFLIEPSICGKIVKELEIDRDFVLEIGPGLGSLSHFLARENCHVDLVDIDQRMIDFLRIHYKDNPNVNLYLSDIRKHKVDKYTKIIGNLPYNITTEIVVYLLKNAIKCKKMILMCQSENFEHFENVSGKEYGPASVFIHMLGTIKKVITVKAGSFYPAPKCSSTVFEIQINENVDFELAYKIYMFSKSIFSNRRKTITNNLLSVIKDKQKISQILSELGISGLSRPEQIPPEQVQKLYFKVYK